MLVDVFGQTFVMLFLGGWLLSPKQPQLADEMKWTFFGFAGNYCLLDWSVLLNLCLFAIQNCFLTFIKVLVNRT